MTATLYVVMKIEHWTISFQLSAEMPSPGFDGWIWGPFDTEYVAVTKLVAAKAELMVYQSQN